MLPQQKLLLGNILKILFGLEHRFDLVSLSVKLVDVNISVRAQSGRLWLLLVGIK